MENELVEELDKCNPQITFTNGYGQNIAKYVEAPKALYQNAYYFLAISVIRNLRWIGNHFVMNKQ